jgi:hypothetical protein
MAMGGQKTQQKQAMLGKRRAPSWPRTFGFAFTWQW